jgi:hypothetical protein
MDYVINAKLHIPQRVNRALLINVQKSGTGVANVEIILVYHTVVFKVKSKAISVTDRGGP